MERVAVVASPVSNIASYVSWAEVNVSTDKGRREVHYYLKRRDGVSDLAVIGKEKNLRHMSYNFTIRNRSVLPASVTFWKLRSRREVIDWLDSVLSDSSPYEPSSGAGYFYDSKHASDLGFGTFKNLQSRQLSQHNKELVWLGSPWTCRKRRKHYQSFYRNGVEISIHGFVFVLAEEDKRLVAYLEDMYEDSKGNKMVVVRWYHKIDEVGIVLPHNFNDREIFFSLCLQDLSIECIDGLATVLSPQHFEKFLNEARHTQLEPFVCQKKFENDDVKPFDITKIKGYWNQDILRYLYPASPLKDQLNCQNATCDMKADGNVSDGFGIRPRKRHRQARDDDAYLNCTDRKEQVDLDVQNFNYGSIECKIGTDSLSLKRRSSAFLSFEETKQNSFEYLRVGSHVEVLSQDSGIRGCWFRALIIKKHKNKVKVRYEDLQDADDEANKLEEWILPSRAADPDDMGIRMCGRTTVRPFPQYNRGRVSWVVDVGTVVDAWRYDGWWEGIVIKKDSQDKLHVYFPGENQESVCGLADVRHSQEWLGNEWMHIKEMPDLVSFILSRSGINQDVKKFHNSAQTAVSDGRQCTKDDTGSNDSLTELRNDKAKDKQLVVDLSKDELLSQLKWNSSRKRRRVSGLHRLHSSLNDRSTTKLIESSGERFLIPTSLKVDHENCKSLSDSLFCSSVVPRLTSLVMSR